MLAIGQHSEVNGSLLGPRCVLHARCVVGSPILIVGEQAGTVMALWTQHTCVLLWLTCYAGPVQRQQHKHVMCAVAEWSVCCRVQA
jgi:hypothetical protein